jgi:AcrR family transcriptional regulator
VKEPAASRPYRMQARADAQAATRARIVDAAVELFMAGWYDEVTLRAIAQAAGVSLQTVINHFGTKDELFTIALKRFSAERREQREAPVDDVPKAIALVVADYDRMGDANVRALALEHRVETLAAALDGGRASHREWCARTFAGALDGLRGADRRRRQAQVQAATDVLMWKLLRRDHGLSRAQTERAMAELVQALYPRRT